MTAQTTFSAKNRTVTGKKVQTLRDQGILPGNVISGGESSVAISVPQKAFVKLYNKVGDTGLIYLEVEDEKKPRPVLVEEVAIHPITGLMSHVVFKQVNLREKITAEVPIEIVGEVEIPNATMIVVADSVEVEALPTDLPEKFEVDVTVLTEIGQSITFAQLSFDTSKISLSLEEEELQNPIVLIQEVKEEVVEEAPEEEATAGAEGEAAVADSATTPEVKPAESAE